MSFNAELYDEIVIQTSYLADNGLAQMGLAGDEQFQGDSCAIVKTQRPAGQKVIAWRVRKTNGKPKCPGTDTGDSNDVLASVHLKPATPAIMADGKTACIQIEGVYSYFMKRPRWPGVDTFAMGTSPISGTPGAMFVLGPEDFDNRILAGVTTAPLQHALPSSLPTAIPAN